MRIGDVFHQLTVIGKKSVMTSGGSRRNLAVVRCECGNVKDVDTSDLRRGKRKSCGCLHSKGPNTGTSFSDKKLYKTWYDLNRNDLLCDEWKTPEVFYESNMLIDRKDKRLFRINNSLPHSPQNSYWSLLKSTINLDNFVYIRTSQNKAIEYEILPNIRIQIDIEDKELLDLFTWNFHKGTFKTSVIQNGRRTTKSLPQIVQFDVVADNLIQKERGTNYRKSNIVAASESQINAKNEKMNKETSSVYKGVSWHKSRNKWHAKIAFEGKSINLGRFYLEADAARAYNDAALKYFGEFATINVIEQ